MLQALVDPRRIAIVGLSSDPEKHGNRVLRNLRKLGYAGEVWGVNPSVPRVEGVGVFGDLASLPHTPDLVVCAVPAASVPQVVRDSVGAAAVVVFAGGFAESGEKGRSLQTRLMEEARGAGLRILGPNSGGVIRPSAGVAASFLTCLDRPGDEIRTGPVGLVTQSGGTGSYLHNLAAARGGGLAISMSTGNEADLDVADGIELVGGLDEVRVVALVVETVRDGARFAGAIERTVAAGKAVVACLVGRGDRARRMVRTHTGALAIGPAVLEGVLDTLGATLTETPAEMLDVAEVLARARAPAGDRVGIVTHSGGFAILLADLAEARRLNLPRPGPRLVERLRPLLHMGSAGNPVDMGGIVGGARRYAQVVDAVASSGDVDVVLAVSTPHPPAHTPARVDGLLALRPPVPVVHLWLAGDLGAAGLGRLRGQGAPVVEEPRAAIRSLEALVRVGSAPARSGLPPIGSTASAAEPLSAPTEHAAKAMLAEWGFDVPEGDLARNPEDAAAIAGRLGGVVAVKVSSPDLPHKSRVGGVRLGVTGPEAARLAYEQVTASALRAAPSAAIEGARVERQRSGPEVVVGAVRDPVFGPVAMVGVGGIAIEAVGGVAFAPAPLDEPGVVRLLHRAFGLSEVLHTVDPDGEATASLSRILAELSERFTSSAWEGIEINPLLWSEGRWWVVDAAVEAPTVPG